MQLKIHPILATAIIAGIIILMFTLFRGCQANKTRALQAKKLMDLTDSSMALSRRAINEWAAAKKAYKDTLEFERGQRTLAEAQKERTEDELNKVLSENTILLKRYKNQQYSDTATVIVPKEFVDDCKDCFSRLEITNGITLKYKQEVADWAVRYKRETGLISGRVAQVEKERDAYRFSVDSINNIQKKIVSSIRPKGRLYLSWGVLWKDYVPWCAGAGLMYQGRRNVIFGASWYYNSKGHMVQTNIHFPLSFRSK